MFTDDFEPKPDPYGTLRHRAIDAALLILILILIALMLQIQWLVAPFKWLLSVQLITNNR